jgi:hypothetical protein
VEIQHAEALTRNLLDQYELFLWGVKIEDARRRVARCYRGTRTIALSRVYVLANDVEVVKDIILHEIAHALTFGGHDAEWRAKYMMLGGSGDLVPGRLVVPDIEEMGGHKISCVDCGATVERLRLDRRLKCKCQRIHSKKTA